MTEPTYSDMEVSDALDPAEALDISSRLEWFDADNQGDLVMLVIPGGGYTKYAENVTTPVAEWFKGLGYSSAVLRYSLGDDAVMPRPLEETVAAIRAMGKKYPGKLIGVIGFSSGGHMAGLAAHADTYLDAADAVPDLVMIGYPLLTIEGDAYDRFAQIVLRGDVTPERKAFWTPINQVDEATPPHFCWACTDDDVVAVADNALPYAQAMTLKGVAHELHLFEQGGHGLGLAEGHPAGAWVALAEAWLTRTVRGLIATRQAESAVQ